MIREFFHIWSWKWSHCCASRRKCWGIEWQYHYKPQVRAATLCKIGIHQDAETTRRSTGEHYTSCWDCHKKLGV